jgi:hypothetical protein
MIRLRNEIIETNRRENNRDDTNGTKLHGAKKQYIDNKHVAKLA